MRQTIGRLFVLAFFVLGGVGCQDPAQVRWLSTPPPVRHFPGRYYSGGPGVWGAYRAPPTTPTPLRRQPEAKAGIGPQQLQLQQQHPERFSQVRHMSARQHQPAGPRAAQHLRSHHRALFNWDFTPATAAVPTLPRSPWRRPESEELAVSARPRTLEQGHGGSQLHALHSHRMPHAPHAEDRDSNRIAPLRVDGGQGAAHLTHLHVNRVEPSPDLELGNDLHALQHSQGGSGMRWKGDSNFGRVRSRLSRPFYPYWLGVDNQTRSALETSVDNRGGIDFINRDSTRDGHEGPDGRWRSRQWWDRQTRRTERRRQQEQEEQRRRQLIEQEEEQRHRQLIEQEEQRRRQLMIEQEEQRRRQLQQGEHHRRQQEQEETRRRKLEHQRRITEQANNRWLEGDLSSSHHSSSTESSKRFETVASAPNTEKPGRLGVNEGWIKITNPSPDIASKFNVDVSARSSNSRSRASTSHDLQENETMLKETRVSANRDMNFVSERKPPARTTVNYPHFGMTTQRSIADRAKFFDYTLDSSVVNRDSHSDEDNVKLDTTPDRVPNEVKLNSLSPENIDENARYKHIDHGRARHFQHNRIHHGTIVVHERPRHTSQGSVNTRHWSGRTANDVYSRYPISRVHNQFHNPPTTTTTTAPSTSKTSTLFSENNSIKSLSPGIHQNHYNSNQRTELVNEISPPGPVINTGTRIAFPEVLQTTPSSFSDLGRGTTVRILSSSSHQSKHLDTNSNTADTHLLKGEESGAKTTAIDIDRGHDDGLEKADERFNESNDISTNKPETSDVAESSQDSVSGAETSLTDDTKYSQPNRPNEPSTITSVPLAYVPKGNNSSSATVTGSVYAPVESLMETGKENALLDKNNDSDLKEEDAEGGDEGDDEGDENTTKLYVVETNQQKPIDSSEEENHEVSNAKVSEDDMTENEIESSAEERISEIRLTEERMKEEEARRERERLNELRREEERLHTERVQQERILEERRQAERREQERLEELRKEEERSEEERRLEERKEWERREQARQELERRLEEQRLVEERERERLEQERREEERKIEERIEEERLEAERRAEERRLEEKKLEETRVEMRRLEARREEEKREQERIEEERKEAERRAEQRRTEERRQEEHRLAERQEEERREEERRLEEARLEEERRRNRIEEERRTAAREEDTKETEREESEEKDEEEDIENGNERKEQIGNQTVTQNSKDTERNRDEAEKSSKDDDNQEGEREDPGNETRDGEGDELNNEDHNVQESSEQGKTFANEDDEKNFGKEEVTVENENEEDEVEENEEVARANIEKYQTIGEKREQEEETEDDIEKEEDAAEAETDSAVRNLDGEADKSRVSSEQSGAEDKEAKESNEDDENDVDDENDDENFDSEEGEKMTGLDSSSKLSGNKRNLSRQNEDGGVEGESTEALDTSDRQGIKSVGTKSDHEDDKIHSTEQFEPDDNHLGKSSSEDSDRASSNQSGVDTSCLDDPFLPAPEVEFANVKYVRSETGGFVEAQYECAEGHELRGEPHMLCRERQWIGSPPHCLPDPCIEDRGGCDHICTAVDGEPECSCRPGYKLEGDYCIDVNECLPQDGRGPCEDACENFEGGYRCTCSGTTGMKLASDGRTCEDIDECAMDNNGCSHKCLNTVGSAFCLCPDGMILGKDWKTCEDETTGNSEDNDNSTDTDGEEAEHDGEEEDGEEEEDADGGDEEGAEDEGVDGDEQEEDSGREDDYVDDQPHGGGLNSVKPFWMACPPDVTAEVARGHHTTNVAIEKPKLSPGLRWKHDVSSDPAWGKRLSTKLPVGDYVLKFRAKHPVTRQKAFCAVVIRVQEPTPPGVAGCPDDVVVNVNGRKRSAKATWSEPTFNDNVGVVKFHRSREPGSRFPIGRTLVAYEAFDAVGLSASCRFMVDIRGHP